MEGDYADSSLLYIPKCVIAKPNELIKMGQSLEEVSSTNYKPHVVCVPYPMASHIHPMLKLAKLLHHRGFHITFVNSEFNHRRLLKSQGPNSLDGLPSFNFATIPDGLPHSEDDVEATQDIHALFNSTRKNCLPYFKKLLAELSRRASAGEIPPVTSIVSDGVASFTLDAAEELGLPNALFWTCSACGLLGYMHYHRLIELGYVPLKDASDLTNGYLDTEIDWIPGMEGIRLKDLPSFIQTTDPNDFMMNFKMVECDRSKRASAIILNTFDALESRFLDSINTISSPVYSIGPLHLLENQVPDLDLKNIGSNFWKEDKRCIEWLDTKPPNSVILVNFGSVVAMTAEHLLEFAWGLAKSNQTFIWVIRPDLVSGPSATLPPSFFTETEGRSFLTNWCPQEAVLNHDSVGGFLTHCGWNSVLESLCAGVPVVCCPFFAEQQTNCRYCCTDWGVGLEIGDVKRDEVEAMVKEVMEGELGKVMKRRAMEWKKMAQEAVASCSGSSVKNLEALINNVLLAN